MEVGSFGIIKKVSNSMSEEYNQRIIYKLSETRVINISEMKALKFWTAPFGDCYQVEILKEGTQILITV